MRHLRSLYALPVPTLFALLVSTQEKRALGHADNDIGNRMQDDLEAVGVDVRSVSASGDHLMRWL